jgi:hypothetical protein
MLSLIRLFIRIGKKSEMKECKLNEIKRMSENTRQKTSELTIENIRKESFKEVDIYVYIDFI